MKSLPLWLHSLAWLSVNFSIAAELALQHGIAATSEIKVQQYWVSEKLDGIRGYWDGKHIYTRQGNKLVVPDYFTVNWPQEALDGELWSGRNQFETISSCVRKKQATPCWRTMRFMVFDLPDNPENFTTRISRIKQLISENTNPYLGMVRQFRLPDQQALERTLQQLVSDGGEGLMLHHQQGLYQSGRNPALMKVKPFQDSDARVIAHLPGKGKYHNKLGALLVTTRQGIEFKIGSGFSDQQRENPPPVGSIITFKYSGKTARGVPRFASFLRIRHQATR